MSVLILIGAAGVTYFASGPPGEAAGLDSPLRERLQEDRRVQWLLIHGPTDRISHLFLLSYEPLSNRFSAVYLDGEHRIVSSRLGGVHRLDAIGERLSPDGLRRDLAEALELELPFWVRTRPEDLSYLVDSVGGVRLELLAPARGDSPSRGPRRTMRWVDGTMALDYASTAYEDYGEQGRRYRHKTLFFAVMAGIRRHGELVDHERFLRDLDGRLDTNLTPGDLRVMGELLRGMQETKVKFPGPVRLKTVGGQSGVLAEETIKNMLPRPLKRIIQRSDPQEMIRVQVLNGAGLPNLAGVVRDFLQPKAGIDVVEVGNAERYNYRTTQIIDRSNNPQSADRIRKILGTGQIVSEPSDRLLVDVTIIAGQDLESMINARS